MVRLQEFQHWDLLDFFSGPFAKFFELVPISEEGHAWDYMGSGMEMLAAPEDFSKWFAEESNQNANHSTEFPSHFRGTMNAHLIQEIFIGAGDGPSAGHGFRDGGLVM
jgi:hypothetical protein